MIDGSVADMFSNRFGLDYGGLRADTLAFDIGLVP